MVVILSISNLIAQPNPWQNPQTNKPNIDSDIIPPTPTAAALAKVFEFPINVFTGSPEITLPLYDIKSGSIQTAISLNYSGSNGIKVQDVAGPVSTGWTLVAGGVITRVVRDHPDETGTNFQGYLYADNSWLNNDTSSTSFKQPLKESVLGMFNLSLSSDLQPDIFNSTIGGRIIFRPNRVPEFIEQKGYTIKRNALYDVNAVWEIVDPKGVRYLFGENSNSVEYTSSSSNSGLLYPTQHNTMFETATSWYLTKIISTSGDIITIDYETGTPYETPYYNTISTATTFTNGATNFSRGDLSIVRAKNPAYIHSISGPNGTATFYYNNRLDNSALRSLDKIVISDLVGNIKTSFRFNHAYFSDGVGNAYNRPKLLSVDQLNSLQDKFISIAKFHYNEDNMLPDRSSSQFDHWGYFNNNTTGKRLISQGAVKTADLAKCKSGVLTSVEWPTGGETKYEYELNRFIENNKEFDGGGLRIKKAQQVEGNNIKETNYSYTFPNLSTSGQLQQKFNPDKGYVFTTPTWRFDYTTGSVVGTTINEYDIPCFELFDLNGRAVGYSRVVITHPNQSKEVQTFQNYDSFPDNITGLFMIVNAGGGTYIYNITNAYDPQKYSYLNFRTPYYLQRGLIKEKVLYNVAGDKLKKFSYSYSSASNSNAIIGIQRQAFTSSTIATSAGGTTTYYTANYYKELPQTIQLTNETVVDYAAKGDSIKIVNQNEYRSAYPFLLEKKIEPISKENLVRETRYFYPDQFAFSGIYWEWITNSSGNMVKVPRSGNNIYSKMVSANMINFAIETVTSIQRPNQPLSIINGNLSVFNDVNTGNLILKEKELSFEPFNWQSSNYLSPTQATPTGITYDGRYQTKISYNKYDSKGNLLELQTAKGLKTSYLYSYGNQYPIAAIKNVDYSSIESLLGGDSIIKSFSESNPTDQQIKDFLLPLRNSILLKDAQVNTYTYRPLEGISSQTDALGRTTYFGYDDFLRLKIIKDQNNKVLKAFYYHYKN
ncbi:hypothetical protein ACFE6N_23175 [Pedobacter sp. BG31]|uniref:hypothetical protein n=1 Tax=Pedobacter sp. BG31 TaxID=3349697 RepID=UPI0035F3F99F